MAGHPVRILSRYLLRQHLAPLSFALSSLTALMVLNQVAKRFPELVGKGLPWSVIAEVFVLSVPFIVAMTLPMAMLVAVLHTMSRLTADHEITAMAANGISVSRIARPVLLGAALVTVGAYLWNDQLLPRTNHRLRTLLVDIQRKKPSFALKEQVINEVVPDQFFLRAARIAQATNRLRDVTIYDLGEADRRRIITADSGRMAYTPGQSDLYLTLVDGDIQEVRRGDDAQFNRTFFHTNHIRVRGVSNQLVLTGEDTYRTDREMTICDMRRAVSAAQDDVNSAHLDADATVERDLRTLAGMAPTVSAPPPAPDTSGGTYCHLWQRITGWALPKIAGAQTAQQPGGRPGVTVPAPAPRPPTRVVLGITTGEDERAQGAQRRAAAYLVEIHKKLAISAACFVFALLGIPVALRFPRGGPGMVIGVGVFVFAIYYIGLIGGEDLGDRLIVSPFLAMWGTNIVFGLLGLAGLWAMVRSSPTPRGGDWSDVRHVLFGWIRRLRRRGREVTT